MVGRSPEGREGKRGGGEGKRVNGKGRGGKWEKEGIRERKGQLK